MFATSCSFINNGKYKVNLHESDKNFGLCYGWYKIVSSIDNDRIFQCYSGFNSLKTGHHQCQNFADLLLIRGGH